MTSRDRFAKRFGATLLAEIEESGFRVVDTSSLIKVSYGHKTDGTAVEPGRIQNYHKAQMHQAYGHFERIIRQHSKHTVVVMPQFGSVLHRISATLLLPPKEAIEFYNEEEGKIEELTSGLAVLKQAIEEYRKP